MLLTLLVVAALVLPRVIGVTESSWFAWPGYLWFALLVYLFLMLLVLEPVRLALRGWTRRDGIGGTGARRPARRAHGRR